MLEITKALIHQKLQLSLVDWVAKRHVTAFTIEIVHSRKWTNQQRFEFKMCSHENIKKLTKWVSFFVCSFGFVWKVTDSVVTFAAKDVGTKIDVRLNQETDFPGFAVCRHPNQILNRFDKQGLLMKNLYNMSISEMRFLSFYQKIEEYNLTR